MRVELRDANKDWRAQVTAARKRAYRTMLRADINEYLFMLSSERRLPELLKLLAWKPGPVFWPVFLENWSACDDTWDFNFLLPEIFRRMSPVTRFLDDDARAFFDSLPDKITVYRGCSRDRVQGISWTTDLKVAEGFARGHRGIRVPDPVVATGLVTKENIFAVFCERQESEVLCCPDVIEVESA